MKQHYFLGTLLAALLAGGAAPAGAQALNYFAVNAQTATTSYTDLGTTGTAIDTPDFDDSNSAAQSLGFSFSYGGASYSQFVLNTNGYLKLGSTAPVAPYFGSGAQDVTGGPLNSADTNLLLPFNTDLEAGTGPTEYRVATTGAAGSRITTIQWKNVSDKARATSATNATVVPKQFANFSFQVRLYEATSAIEFIYGPATATASAVATSVASVALKGSSTATSQVVVAAKNVASSWGGLTFSDGPYASSTTGFGFRNSVLPDAGRLYRFNLAIANDVTLAALYSIEQLPATQAYIYRAKLFNRGSTTQTNLVATLQLTGANAATLTQTVPSLAPGASILLAWPALPLLSVGTSTVTATIPADATPADNSQTATTVTVPGTVNSPAVFSYYRPGATTSAFGFGGSSTPYTSASCAAYTTSTPFTFTVVRARLSDFSTSVGQKVYGLLADLNGKVLGQSPEYTIQASDLGTLHTFVLTTSVTVPPSTILAGLAQEIAPTTIFGIATQAEPIGRTGTFYTLNSISAAGQGFLNDISTSLGLRFLVEAGGYGTVLAAAAPTLTQALTVFPNPSATGQFSLAIQGAAAPDGLAVSVINQLGQVVYTGTARDNYTTKLDLSSLAAGLYHLQVRHGAETMTRQLAIVK